MHVQPGYVQSMQSRENRSMLHEIQEPMWSYIIDHCSSFVTTDCNAAFSQIFQERTFGYLSEEEESLFTSAFRLGEIHLDNAIIDFKKC